MNQREKTIYDLLFNIAIYSPKNIKKYLSEMKLIPEQFPCNKRSFRQFGVHFGGSSKMVVYHQIFHVFFDVKPSYKKE